MPQVNDSERMPLVSLEEQDTSFDSLLEDPRENEENVQLRNTALEPFPRIQNACNLAAHGVCLLTILIVGWWIHHLGGLSWKQGESKLVFNWHPLLMVTAFCFMTIASLSFRFPYKSCNRSTVKLVHGTAWAVTALCAIIALIAVFRSHNDPMSGFIANLYSFHSWLGIAVILMYVAQFSVGFFSFGWNLSFVTTERKALVLQVHTFAGRFIYLGTAMTVLLGIQEKEGFIGCAYKVDKADIFPLQHLGKIPSACLISHLLGLLVFATALCTSIALHDFSRCRGADEDRRNR